MVVCVTGLPEQYYSLTWFLSPILGLIFTPLIGSASDRCTLSWGRRRPFILALCVGVLFGVALFLNGSAIGLALGDVPTRQPIGIVLTVLGVVVLDFSADATEGPIRAYLLDVVDSEEQDMALNIHAFSAGLGGAVGYVLGGLDWTQTFLGSWFRTQNQVLFFFAAIIFTVSVALHLSSIEEEQYSPQQERSGDPTGTPAPGPRACVLDGGALFPDEAPATVGPARRRRHVFRRQASSTFSYYGKIGSHRYRHRRANAVVLIKPSRSMSDLYDLQARPRQHRHRHQSGATTSSGDSESEEGEGETTALSNSTEWQAYSAGVKMGCWGLVIYAATGATCSGPAPAGPALEDSSRVTFIAVLRRSRQRCCWDGSAVAPQLLLCRRLLAPGEGLPGLRAMAVLQELYYEPGGRASRVLPQCTQCVGALLQKCLDNYDLSIRAIYVLGTLGFSVGTAVMAVFANVYVAMSMISTMGVVSMSVSYCPYALLGQYHDLREYVHHSPGASRRGFGIDCAILSCQVYISQILVASALGSVVDAVGTVRVIPMVASVGSFLGFLTAAFLVIYPEVSEEAKEEQKGLSSQPLGEGASGSAEKPMVLKLSRKEGPQGLVETESMV
ncbi:hypothetical protein Celaphus_00016164 [Cervus elaphus hippelaphus]|uniref:Uncharacterized protein n=1 Tax=Cervus elaphus hippelaphus TaxID=46360 RepID=A0A212CEP6_CEREH|nr:hypothetical protein Celaphus_00016164 [Cervus elaphus hippelaphus]